MGLSVRRQNRRIGRSSDYLNIPKPIKVGKASTIAANRLILADPRGEIPERELLEFMEEQIEPVFWEWYKNWKNAGGKNVK